MQEWYLGWEKVILERCPQFRGVEVFHYQYLSKHALTIIQLHYNTLTYSEASKHTLTNSD